MTTVVIGAGIIGTAIAHDLQKLGLFFGTEISK